jgi:hypothetical protein
VEQVAFHGRSSPSRSRSSTAFAERARRFTVVHPSSGESLTCDDVGRLALTTLGQAIVSKDLVHSLRLNAPPRAANASSGQAR